MARLFFPAVGGRRANCANNMVIGKGEWMETTRKGLRSGYFDMAEQLQPAAIDAWFTEPMLPLRGNPAWQFTRPVVLPCWCRLIAIDICATVASSISEAHLSFEAKSGSPNKTRLSTRSRFA